MSSGDKSTKDGRAREESTIPLALRWLQRLRAERGVDENGNIPSASGSGQSASSSSTFQHGSSVLTQYPILTSVLLRPASGAGEIGRQLSQGRVEGNPGVMPSASQGAMARCISPLSSRSASSQHDHVRSGGHQRVEAAATATCPDSDDSDDSCEIVYDASQAPQKEMEYEDKPMEDFPFKKPRLM